MAASLLVLGATGFVGRAAVLEGLARGWEVTTFNRGHAAAAAPDVRRVIGDRLDPRALKPLTSGEWDLVLDTLGGPPRAVRDSATILVARADRYIYISSGSVYAPPPPMEVRECAPTVAASPDAEAGDYAACKRGAELAVAEAFGARALSAGAGTILGPHEDVGRLTWWLTRGAAGGEILAPGPPELRSNTSTLAIWRSSCSTPCSRATVAPSTWSAGAGTRRWRRCSRPASRWRERRTRA